MTEVGFHTQVGEPLGYACRLLRKALQQGAQVTVTGPAAALQRLDLLLWTFDPLSFVPHALLREGQAVEPRLRRTPIWLVLPGAETPMHDVLVHLGGDPPAEFGSFRRIVEIVGTDAGEVQAARRRWRDYKERGYPVEHHEAGA